MLLLISPAKTLSPDKCKEKKHSIPNFLKESEDLVSILCQKTTNDLKKLMKVSDKIAELNVERYKNFTTPFTLENAKQAILAFKGDVYRGLEAESFDEADLDFAQKHLRILSGLYGILRPMDLMQPYRLEMGTRLDNQKGKNLYEFWDEKITNTINSDTQINNDEAVINLASNEYFKSVKPALLDRPLYTANFKEWKGDKYKIIAFNAKKARGMMCQYVIKNRLTNPADLKGFNMDGYSYNEELSEDKSFIFTR